MLKKSWTTHINAVFSVFSGQVSETWESFIYLDIRDPFGSQIGIEMDFRDDHTQILQDGPGPEKALKGPTSPGQKVKTIEPKNAAASLV
jgi:hypothetical protein